MRLSFIPVRVALLQNTEAAPFAAYKVSLPVRVALLQNDAIGYKVRHVVSLPVRVALLQNALNTIANIKRVSLPVRVALLQNYSVIELTAYKFHYQSGWHYSKTNERPARLA